MKRNKGVVYHHKGQNYVAYGTKIEATQYSPYGVEGRGRIRKLLAM